MERVSAHEEDVDELPPFMMAKEEKRLAVLEVLRMVVADGMEGARTDLCGVLSLSSLNL